MNTLQQLINKRAEHKLDGDIQELSKAIRSNKLIIDTTSGNYPTLQMKHSDGTFASRSISDIFYWSSYLMKDLREYWLPKYIEEETKLFLKEIEDTKARVEILDDEINSIYSYIPQ